MIEFDNAKEIAGDYLRRTLGSKFGDNIVLLEKETLTKEYGWIFFYQHRKWLETGKVRDALIGNGPILIDKQTGKIVQFGSAGTVDYWCQLYEQGKTREDADGIIHLLFGIGPETRT